MISRAFMVCSFLRPCEISSFAPPHNIPVCTAYLTRYLNVICTNVEKLCSHVLITRTMHNEYLILCLCHHVRPDLALLSRASNFVPLSWELVLQYTYIRAHMDKFMHALSHGYMLKRLFTRMITNRDTLSKHTHSASHAPIRAAYPQRNKIASSHDNLNDPNQSQIQSMLSNSANYSQSISI